MNTDASPDARSLLIRPWSDLFPATRFTNPLAAVPQLAARLAAGVAILLAAHSYTPISYAERRAHRRHGLAGLAADRLSG
ncbi:MAG: hypothetical protein K2X06_09910 [Burkholderiales bacterium]|nr:hypothetical protein [Burkholderiales bacterium]